MQEFLKKNTRKTPEFEMQKKNDLRKLIQNEKWCRVNFLRIAAHGSENQTQWEKFARILIKNKTERKKPKKSQRTKAKGQKDKVQKSEIRQLIKQ